MFDLTSISFLSQMISACRLGSGGQSDTCLKCLFLHVFLDEFSFGGWLLLQELPTSSSISFLQGLASLWTLSSVQLSFDRSALIYPLLYFHSSSRSHFTSLKHFIFLTQNMKQTRGIFVRNFYEEFFPNNVFVRIFFPH